MKNIFLVISSGLLILSISSCCKPFIGFKSILKNTTDQEIDLKYFDNFGQVLSSSIKEKSETIAPIGPPVSGVVDSVLVFRNLILQEIHYSIRIKKISSNATVIPYESSRNLLNESSYQKIREELPCNGSSTIYMYAF